MEQMRIVDPCGLATADDELAFEPAARPGALAGMRLATLDNGKPNAAHTLNRMAALLGRRAGVAAGRAVTKALASQPCPDEQLAEFADVDIAFVGVGD